MITLALFVLFLVIAGILLYFGSKNNFPVWTMGCILLMGIGMMFLYGEADISEPIGTNIQDINADYSQLRTVYVDVNVSNNVLLESTSYFFVFGGLVGLLIGAGMLYTQFRK